MASCAIIVFAKAPVPGEVKTRLMPALGATGAARLAQQMLEHTVKQAVEAGTGPVEICCSPKTAHPLFEHLARQYGLCLTTQGEGDLGERMHRAFTRRLASAGKALLVGTDAPALDGAMLRLAAQALDETQAVFIPTVDGGYVLAGLREPLQEVFTRVTWSTSTVMDETRARLRRHAVTWKELAVVHDLDQPADLVHLPQEWRA